MALGYFHLYLSVGKIKKRLLLTLKAYIFALITQEKPQMAKKLTSNNVINNNLITNNNNVIMDCDTTQSTNKNIPLEESLRSSFEEIQGSGAESGSDATRQTSPLPKLWQWVKLDLFDNSKTHKAKHKLSISICKGGEIQNYRSLNNSPFANFKRGFVDYAHDTHYNVVRNVYRDLKQQGYKPQVSKCFTRGYQGKVHDTIFGLSTILCREEQDHRYLAALIAEEELMLIRLKGDAEHLTEKQRQNRVIATGSIMRPAKPYGGLRAKDILF